MNILSHEPDFSDEMEDDEVFEFENEDSDLVFFRKLRGDRLLIRTRDRDTGELMELAVVPRAQIIEEWAEDDELPELLKFLGALH